MLRIGCLYCKCSVSHNRYQFFFSQQMALNKLSQSEIWNTLSPVQQRALLMQKVAMAQQPPLNIDQLAQVEKNPLSQLIYQMQQVFFIIYNRRQ